MSHSSMTDKPTAALKRPLATEITAFDAIVADAKHKHMFHPNPLGWHAKVPVATEPQQTFGAYTAAVA